MIAVLQHGQEVADSILALQQKGLPLHATPQKNWDHFLLHDLLRGVDRSARLLDSGCGEGYTLDFLFASGFREVVGIDFEIGLKLRLKQGLRMWRARSLARPYRVYRGDLLRTPFASESFDVVLSVSTIEHGVDTDRFFAESARLLKPKGKLFLTTDYWEEPLAAPAEARPFKLPWKVFSKTDIEALVVSAQRFGLVVGETAIPSCHSTPVFWNGLSYTFIALAFEKR